MYSAHSILFSSTSSPAQASCQSSPSISSPTPISSPVPFSAPPTPSYTPCCTPRRLSLSFSLAESFTNLRDSTKTTSTSMGLVRLLLERGISASVYNPRSWDRGLDASGASKTAWGAQEQQSINTQGESEPRQQGKRPDSLTLQPSTPPNSPRSKSASCASTCSVFQFSPSSDDPPFYNTFLASKPARTILREVLGETEIERGGKIDDDSQTEMLKLRLVDKLKCFRTVPSHAGSVSPGSALLASFGSTELGNNALGGGFPGLNAGLRRNRSYPAMVGASMAMKDPGGPPSRDSHTTCNADYTCPAHSAQTGNGHNASKSQLITESIHIPQTRHTLETVSPQTVIQKHTNCGPSSSTSSD